MKEKTGIILVSLLAMLLLLLCACGKMQRAEICIEQIVAKEGNGENTEQLFMMGRGRKNATFFLSILQDQPRRWRSVFID